MLDGLRNSLLSLVFPQACYVCGDLVERSAEGVCCRKCWMATRFFNGEESLCTRCGAFLGDKSSGSAVHCRECRGHAYDSAVSLGVYEKGLSAAIINLKASPVIPSYLEKKLILRSKSLETKVDLLVPVPLSRRRMLERGFNQAELIANKISRQIDSPVDAHSLRRTVNTQIHRMGMDQKARELTVAQAFEVKRPKLISGKRILLIDDVLTSGSTASACAKVLKKAGAESVNVFTLARAVYH